MSELRWHESMRGRVGFGAPDETQGWWDGTRCAIHLDLSFADRRAFVADPEHPAPLTGVMDCPALGGRLEITDGCFNLLVATGVRMRELRYRLFLRDRDGRDLTLVGVKDVQDDAFRDAWTDTSTLFTRIYAGRVEAGAEDAAGAPLARGILRVSVVGFARLLLSMRGPLRAKASYARLFTGGLFRVYLGPRGRDAEPDRLDAAAPGGGWEAVPERPALRRAVHPVVAGDGRALSLHHLAPADREPAGDPVLLMHGTGTRAQVFYGAPVTRTLPEALLAAGLDVWVANWRGSIDFDPHGYTLDEVARFDHPALIAAVLAATGRTQLKAVVHCQGSTSFALAAAAGLVPEVTDVVSTGVSFHVDVIDASRRRMGLLLPLLRPGYAAFDPQWAIRPAALRGRLFARWARLVRRECHQPVCQMANYVYGAGGDVLWAHRNLDAATHHWIANEFGWVPTSIFRQIARCARAGEVVAVDGSGALPAHAARRRPANMPRWTLLTGGDNRCFLPSGQERTFAWLESLEAGRHRLAVIPGYTHLDLFFGARAHEDVHPHIVAALA